MSLPRIDLAPRRADDRATAARVATELRDALRDVGFVTIVGHGAEADIAAILPLARRFFALDAAAKHALAPRRWNPASPNVYRGYFPSSADGKEGWDLGEPARVASDAAEGPYAEANLYPDTPGTDWRGELERHYAALHGVGTLLLAALAEVVGGDPAAACGAFARPESLSTLRFNFYPESATPHTLAKDDGAPLVCEAHADSGMLTLLAQDEVGGLQVRTRERRWVDVAPEPGALVVNAGRALQQASEGVVRATPHRVLYAHTERLSVPFFFEPGPECPVGPAALGRPAPQDDAPRYEDFLRDSLRAFPEYAR